MFLSMINYKVTKGKARDYDFLSDESEYYEALGRINLYDMDAVLSDEDDDQDEDNHRMTSFVRPLYVRQASTDSPRSRISRRMGVPSSPNTARI